MFLYLPYWIGNKFITSCKKQGFFAFLYLFSTLGISLSVAILTIVISCMHGFEKELNNRILSLIPHIEIESIKYQSANEWNNLINQLQKNKSIIYIEPYIQKICLIEHQKKIKIIKIRSLNIKNLNTNNLYKILKKEENFKISNYENNIIIGNEIAKYFNIKINSWITLIFNDEIFNLKKLKLKVTGIINTHSILDNTLAIITLLDAQKYFNMIDNFTGIELKTYSPFNIDNIIDIMRKKISHSFYLKNWKTQYGYIYKDISMIKTIVYISITLIIFISAFTNMSIILMIVKNKNKEIAILKTLGATKSLINKIFLIHGLIISIFSNVFGLLIGILASTKISFFINIIEKFFNKKIFSENIYFIDFIPTEIKYIDILFIFFTTIIFNLLTSYYPSRRANKIILTSLINQN